MYDDIEIFIINQNHRKNVEEYFGELLPHAANGNSKKKKNIEEYFGSEIDLNKPELNKADLKLRGLINPPHSKDEGILETLIRTLV